MWNDFLWDGIGTSKLFITTRDRLKAWVYWSALVVFGSDDATALGASVLLSECSKWWQQVSHPCSCTGALSLRPDLQPWLLKSQQHVTKSGISLSTRAYGTRTSCDLKHKTKTTDELTTIGTIKGSIVTPITREPRNHVHHGYQKDGRTGIITASDIYDRGIGKVATQWSRSISTDQPIPCRMWIYGIRIMYWRNK